MPEFFHQNMRSFYPGGPLSAVRVPAYAAEFAQVALSAPNIEVVGLTEVMSTRAPAGTWAAITTPLFGGAVPAVAHPITIGRTAANRKEYLLLACRTRPHAFGRIVFSSAPGAGGGPGVVVPWPDRPANPAFPTVAWANRLPNGALLDYRAIVYVVIDLYGQRVAVGLLHNIWSVNDNRSAMVARMPLIIRLIQSDPAFLGVPNPDVYILGDFNAAPIVRQGHGLVLVPYAQPILPAIAPPPAPAPAHPEWHLTAAQAAAGGQSGGTTLNGPGSFLDYAYAVSHRPNPTCGIDVRTIDYLQGSPLPGLMSDHAGVVFRP